MVHHMSRFARELGSQCWKRAPQIKVISRRLEVVLSQLLRVNCIVLSLYLHVMPGLQPTLLHVEKHALYYIPGGDLYLMVGLEARHEGGQTY